jgi:hypothetical protein
LLLEIGLEAIETSLPPFAIEVDPPADLMHITGPQSALANATELLCDDEVRVFEDANVLQHAGQRETDRSGEVADRSRPGRQALEDVSPGGICQC